MAHHHNGGSTGGGGGHPPGFAFMDTTVAQAPPSLRVPVVDGRLGFVQVTDPRSTYFKEYNSPLPHSRYPTAGGSIGPPTNFSLPSADVQQQQQQQQPVLRDYHRTLQLDIREKRSNDSKKSTDQAVQQHFDESLRLANQKKWQQQQLQAKYEDETISRSALPPAGAVSTSVGLDKPFYGAPGFEPAKGPIESKVSLYSKGGPALPRPRDPQFPVHRREPERLPGINHGKSNLGNYYQPPVARAKVSSPAPPQFYGKPDARLGAPSNVPSARHYPDPAEAVPLSLTSKNNSVLRNSPPVTSGSSLPQHEVRSAELTNFYMHSSGPGGYGGGSISPSPQLQPLDLGGKRKSESETVLPPNLEPKKIKNEDLPLDLKAGARMVMPTAGFPVNDMKPLKVENKVITGNSFRVMDGLSAVSPYPVKSDKPTNLLGQPIPPSQSSPYDFSRESVSPLDSSSALISKAVEPVPACQPVIAVKGTSPSDVAGSRVANTSPSTVPNQAEPVVPSIESTSNSQEQNPPQVISGSTAPKKNWLEKYSGEDGEISNRIQGRPSKVNSPNSGYLKGGNENSGENVNKNGQVNFSSNAKSSNGGMNRKPDGVKSRRRGDDSESKSTSGSAANSNSRRQPLSSDTEEDNDRRGGRRVPPKAKRKNGRRSKKRAASPGEAGDSENNNSDSGGSSSKGKDSQSNPSTPPELNLDDRKGGRPRGRASSPKYDKKNPFKKKPVKQLKSTGEAFLQDRACPESKEIHKCRECRIATGLRGKKQNPFCRFYAFRKLCYNKKGALDFAGFSDPMDDASEEDKNLWLPGKESLPKCLEFSMSKTLIEHLGDQFCALVKEENEAAEMSNRKRSSQIGGKEGRAAWKRVIKGVRDMCDVCETTLFNYHWACEKCGFVVCIACYKSRKNNTAKISSETGKDRDKYSWLMCMTQRGKVVEDVEHDLDSLMLTQVIAGDALTELGRKLHLMREKYGIPQLCGCADTNKPDTVAEQQPVGGSNGVSKEAKQSHGSSSSDDSEDDEDEEPTLRNIIRTQGSEEKDSGNEKENEKQSLLSSSGNTNLQALEKEPVLKYYASPKLSNYHRQLLPIRNFTLSESQRQYPDLPHSWLCAGRLLKLEDPAHAGNVRLFQDMWKRGQPVLVANVASRLSKDLWTPSAFSKDARLQVLKSDLVNCISGKTLSNQPIKRFWEGFDQVEKRLKDEVGNPMLLKLKDWPPGEDFADLLPDRFEDLMKALPLTDYTDRNGRLNLAARLPDIFVRPDLGPKMYIAYGSGTDLEKGTTNLHLDISDAVNVMVHVGVPEDVDNSDHIKEVKKAIAESDCDAITVDKVLQNVKTAGALWHIYNSRDADKIRDLLNKVAMERKIHLEPNQDPIHDQSWYLDRDLRKRLMDEYDVCGYPIIQCLGDAVFIPAGAPHQVRNLNNCIKIAEDFVSPENVSHCFDLTEEFRRLSDTHQNHEDKLQIKNIMYHSVKDAISVLMYGGPEEPTTTSPTVDSQAAV